MNEQKIIQQLSLIYSFCRSYEDQGQLETITDPGTGSERHEHVAFRTAFVRPMLFRFEWRRLDPFTGKPDDTETIWCDGHTAYSRNRFELGVQEYESLEHALATATSVWAHVVSSLLMPDILSFKFMRHGNLSAAPDEMMFNEECCHLFATTDEQRTDILVGKRSHALRRMREERIIKGGNLTLPPLPPAISAAEREEMIRVLTEAAEDLHTIADCSYTHVSFDSNIPEQVFHPVF